MTRLFVLLANQAHVAAILRRGPSDWYQVIRWDTDRDVFTDGAWFKGRIYEERCDVSPDGELLLYFCHGGRMREEYTDSWTAVSRLPWLHAIGLWPSGTTYGGGGRFTSDRSLTLRTAMPVEAHPSHPGRGLEVRGLERGASLEVHTSAATDHAGNVISTEGGQLFRGNTLLANFSDRTPTPEEAPEWARMPLAR